MARRLEMTFMKASVVQFKLNRKKNEWEQNLLNKKTQFAIVKKKVWDKKLFQGSCNFKGGSIPNFNQ